MHNVHLRFVSIFALGWQSAGTTDAHCCRPGEMVHTLKHARFQSVSARESGQLYVGLETKTGDRCGHWKAVSQGAWLGNG